MKWIEYCCCCHYYYPRRMCGVDYRAVLCLIWEAWLNEEARNILTTSLTYSDRMMSWLEEETAQEANTPRTPNMEKEERQRARSKSSSTPGRDTTSHARLHTERAVWMCSIRPAVLIGALRFGPSLRRMWWGDVRHRAGESRSQSYRN